MMETTTRDGAIVAVLSVVAAMLIGMLILAAIGYDPVPVYEAFLLSALGGEVQIARTLLISGPLILTGLSVAFAFRAGLFNIGANGQAIAGLLAGGVVAFSVEGLPAIVHVPLVVLVAALAGGAWGAIAGVLKVTRGAHEVVTTIMLNFIAIGTGQYLLRRGGPLQDGSSIPQSETFAASSRLPVIWSADPFTNVRIDVLIALLAAALAWFVLARTSLGLQVRSVGHAPMAAEYAGMSVARVTVISMFIAGAFAGIAGAAVSQTPEVARLQSGELAVLQIGFTGIAVALLGRSSAAGVVLAGLLFGAMFAGSTGIQSALQAADAAAGVASAPGVGGYLVQVIQGLIVLFVGADLLLRKLVHGRRSEEPVVAEEAGV